MAELGGSLLAFGQYFAVAIVLTMIFLVIYVRTTPHNEYRLMRDGNAAAALGLTGALLGFVIPLGTVISVSYQLDHVAIWGGVALVVQIVGQLGARLLFPRLSTDISEGKYSAAIIQAGMALALGILQAACWTP